MAFNRTAYFQLQEVPLDYHGELRPIPGPTVQLSSKAHQAQQSGISGVQVYGEAGGWTGGIVQCIVFCYCELKTDHRYGYAFRKKYVSGGMVHAFCPALRFQKAIIRNYSQFYRR